MSLAEERTTILSRRWFCFACFGFCWVFIPAEVFVFTIHVAVSNARLHSPILSETSLLRQNRVELLHALFFFLLFIFFTFLF